MEVFLVFRNDIIMKNYFFRLIDRVVEKNKILRIKSRDSKFNSLIGKLLLQYCFAKKYDVKSIKLQKNKYKKPYLKNSKYYFNLSHSKNKIALVIDSFPVGIDIECIEDFEYDLIGSIFTQEEQNYLNIFTNNEEKNIEIFKLWTQKESFVKCIGKGFFHNIHDTNMIVNNKLIYKITYNENNYYFHYRLLNKSFLISVCSPNKIKEINITYISLEKIIEYFL